MIDLNTVTKDLDALNKEINSAERELAQAEAQKELLQKQGKQYGVESVDEAKGLITENEKRIERNLKFIEAKYNKLKELYEW